MSEPRALRVVTYNVWFDPLKFGARCEAIFAILRASDADVICLQEVLPKFIKLLRTQPWLAPYELSGGEESVQPYGVLMLCRRSLRPHFCFHELPTLMSRKLLTAKLTVPVLPQATAHDSTATLMVGTVHLESLDNHRVRVEQLRVAKKVLASCPNSVLVGDFNFCSYRNYSGHGALENNCLQEVLSGYKDVWSLLRPQDHGFTFDSEVNHSIGHPEQMRYDRVCIKSGHWFPKQIQLLGTQDLTAYLPPEWLASQQSAQTVDCASGKQVSYGGHGRGGLGCGGSPAPLDLDRSGKMVPFEQVWPSDHFGLVANIVYQASV